MILSNKIGILKTINLIKKLKSFVIKLLMTFHNCKSREINDTPVYISEHSIENHTF